MSSADDNSISSRGRMSRRAALAAATSLCAAFLARRLGRPENDLEADLRLFGRRVIKLTGLGNFSAIRPLAAARSRSLQQIVEKLLGVDVKRSEALNISDRALRARLDAQILRDYRAGRVVQLHGWWVSATEALCIELLHWR